MLLTLIPTMLVRSKRDNVGRNLAGFVVRLFPPKLYGIANGNVWDCKNAIWQKKKQISVLVAKFIAFLQRYERNVMNMFARHEIVSRVVYF